MDLYYRQVMDNMARLSTVPGSLPHIAVLGSGTTQITDSAGLDTLELHWAAHDSFAGILGRRDLLENWSLKPVAEPDRLRALQRLFQAAMQPGPVFARVAADLPTVDTGLADSRAPLLNELLSRPVPAGWFGTGRWFEMPAGAWFGRYRGTYAWVRPGRMHDLSEFTLRVLEIVAIESANVEPKPAGFKYGTAAPGATFQMPGTYPVPQFYPQGR